MSARPWFKFYPSDWQAELGASKLLDRRKRLVARDAPVDALGRAPRAPHVTKRTADRTRRTCQPLPNLFDECAKLVDELRQAKVFSATRKAVIFSRKMVRDEKKSSNGKRTGKLGGNPQLLKSAREEPLTKRDNPQWNMASGLSKEGTNSKEESEGEDGPFTGWGAE